MYLPKSLLGLILFACGSAGAQPQWRFDDVERFVAIADIHGAYDAFEATLSASRLIDQDLNWIGSTNHLVIVGDVLDRGPESRRALDLIMQLEAQARDAGGTVHLVLGNHELMNLSGDLRDVSGAEFASYGGESGHRDLFAPDGEYGSWLLTLPVMAQIGDILNMRDGKVLDSPVMTETIV